MIDYIDFGTIECSRPNSKLGVLIYPFISEGTYSKYELTDNGKVYHSQFTENEFKNFENNAFVANKPKIISFSTADYKGMHLAMWLDFTEYPYTLSYSLSDQTLFCRKL